MKTKLLLLTLLMSAFSWGQFNIAAGGTNYTQNFNTLTNGAWSNNTTLTGWYAKTTATASITNYGANTGTTTTAGLYAYGINVTNPLSERALGHSTSNAYTGSAGSGLNLIGWRLKNTTGGDITSITITYTGEQWRKDNTVAHSMNVEYLVGTTVTDLTTTGWTSIPALTFTSPIITSGAAALDGNAPANRVANITTTITVTVPDGEEIMIRWSDLNDSANDHHLAIDDVTVNATVSSGCTDPVAQATDIVISNPSTTGYTISWTAGSPSTGTMVVMRQTANPLVAPTSGTTYAANTAFGSGADLGSNNFVFIKARAHL